MEFAQLVRLPRDRDCELSISISLSYGNEAIDVGHSFKMAARRNGFANGFEECTRTLQRLYEAFQIGHRKLLLRVTTRPELSRSIGDNIIVTSVIP